tara:strand:+ start:256 stop:369 length:114 start_codon:yes stop_codon:yes gene_type:complete
MDKLASPELRIIRGIGARVRGFSEITLDYFRLLDVLV